MELNRACTILSRQALSEDTLSLTLGVGDMVRTSLRGPGQFVHIRCGEGQLLRRPLSVASWTCAPEGDTLTLIFEIRGAGTAWLARQREGTNLDVLGLLGNGFTLPKGRVLLAGGGIGIPPLLGCAREAGGRATALLGFRSRERDLFSALFAPLCEGVHLCSDDGTLGTPGFVDALLRRELDRDPRYEAILACGPTPMLKAVARVAAEYAIPCQVSLEQRMGCGVGACLVCACDMADGSRKHVCRDGPVFPAEEVNWDA